MNREDNAKLVDEYRNQRPNLDEIWCFIMESVISFEDDRGMSRREVCEGLFFAMTDLIVKREDQPFFMPYEDIRDYHKWMEHWLGIVKGTIPSEAAQRAYEAVHGEVDLDAKKDGWVARKITEH